MMIVVALAGCEGERRLISPEDVGSLGVNAVMYVDQHFGPVQVYRAQQPTHRFNFGDAAERGATVTIWNEGVTVRYTETLGGVYVPTTSEPPDHNRVRPSTTYRLEILATTGERLTATTTTPPRLEIREWVLLDAAGIAVQRQLGTYEEYGDQVYYAPENQLIYAEGLLEARVEPTAAAGYQVGVYSLDENSPLVIDPDFLSEEDLAEIEREIASPLILPSEVALRLPWFAIFFQNEYKIKVFAVDLNWYDLVRSVPELAGGGFGFGGNAGDDFDRPIFHVDGGIGLFGSAAMDSVGFFVHPRP
jgi:hypothetical protein